MVVTILPLAIRLDFAACIEVHLRTVEVLVQERLNAVTTILLDLQPDSVLLVVHLLIQLKNVEVILVLVTRLSNLALHSYLHPISDIIGVGLDPVVVALLLHLDYVLILRLLNWLTISKHGVGLLLLIAKVGHLQSKLL